MRLTWKIGLPTCGVLLFSLALLGFLNLHKFEQLLDSQAISRVSVVASDGKAAIEQSLAFGLPLAESQNLMAVIERALALDAEVAAAFIVDLDRTPGHILHAAGMHAAAAPGDWRSRQARAGRGGWRYIDARGHLIMGWPLLDPLDRVAGVLVFDVRRERHAAMVAEAAWQLAVVVAGLGVLLAAVAAVVMRVLLGPVEAALDRAARGEP